MKKKRSKSQLSSLTNESEEINDTDVSSNLDIDVEENDTQDKSPKQQNQGQLLSSKVSNEESSSKSSQIVNHHHHHQQPQPSNLSFGMDRLLGGNKKDVDHNNSETDDENDGETKSRCSSTSSSTGQVDGRTAGGHQSGLNYLQSVPTSMAASFPPPGLTLMHHHQGLGHGSPYTWFGSPFMKDPLQSKFPAVLLTVVKLSFQ